MLVIGGTGSGKSVFMNALMSQTEQQFHRTVIIEEGFSYATYTQTLGAAPIVLQLDGELTLNYLDTGGLPLSHHHVGSAAALCLKMIGASDSEDTNKRRLGQLGEYINRLYADAAADWMMANEGEVPALQRSGFALDRYRTKRMQNGATFLDTYLSVAEWRRKAPEEVDEYEEGFDESEIVRWASSRDGERLCRDLIFSRWNHADYENLTHHSLYMALRYGAMSHHDRSRDQLSRRHARHVDPRDRAARQVLRRDFQYRPRPAGASFRAVAHPRERGGFQGSRRFPSQ